MPARWWPPAPTTRCPTTSPPASSSTSAPSTPSSSPGGCARRTSTPRSCPTRSPPPRCASARPAALILSGGPKSVHVEGAPRLDPEIYELGVPDPRHLLRRPAHRPAARRRGGPGRQGRVRAHGAHRHRRRRRAACSADQPADQTVWMSHFDGITRVPEGFAATATSDGAPVAALESPARRIWGVQYHPEVVAHAVRPAGHRAVPATTLAGCPPTWTMTSIIEQQVAAVRAQVGDARVICALSGGVDSAVAAALVHKAIGPQLTCVFVDTGLLRQGEGEQVVETFQRHQRIELIHVRAADRFFERLAGRHRPRGQAQDHRRAVHPHLRGDGRRARGRPLPRAGHALPRRDRVGRRRRRLDHQEPPQRRRPARGHDLRAGRAAAGAVQGRGPQGRRGAGPARGDRVAPAVPGPGPRRAHHRRGHARQGGDAPARRRHRARGAHARPASSARSGSRSPCCPTSARWA